VFDGGFLLNLGFYCIMGDYFVSWVLVGGFILSWGLLCIKSRRQYIFCATLPNVGMGSLYI
jgi:hypothetical protein